MASASGPYRIFPSSCQIPCSLPVLDGVVLPCVSKLIICHYPPAYISSYVLPKCAEWCPHSMCIWVLCRVIECFNASIVCSVYYVFSLHIGCGWVLLSSVCSSALSPVCACVCYRSSSCDMLFSSYPILLYVALSVFFPYVA